MNQERNHFESLDCPICQAMYNDNDRKPLTINCGHSVCETCLSFLQAKARTSGQTFLSCPVCRQRIELAGELRPRTNYDQLNFADQQNQSGQRSPSSEQKEMNHASHGNKSQIKYRRTRGQIPVERKSQVVPNRGLWDVTRCAASGQDKTVACPDCESFHCSSCQSSDAPKCHQAYDMPHDHRLMFQMCQKQTLNSIELLVANSDGQAANHSKGLAKLVESVNHSQKTDKLYQKVETKLFQDLEDALQSVSKHGQAHQESDNSVECVQPEKFLEYLNSQQTTENRMGQGCLHEPACPPPCLPLIAKLVETQANSKQSSRSCEYPEAMKSYLQSAIGKDQQYQAAMEWRQQTFKNRCVRMTDQFDQGNLSADMLTSYHVAKDYTDSSWVIAVPKGTNIDAHSGKEVWKSKTEPCIQFNLETHQIDLFVIQVPAHIEIRDPEPGCSRQVVLSNGYLYIVDSFPSSGTYVYQVDSFGSVVQQFENQILQSRVGMSVLASSDHLYFAGGEPDVGYMDKDTQVDRVFTAQSILFRLHCFDQQMTDLGADGDGVIELQVQRHQPMMLKRSNQLFLIGGSTQGCPFVPVLEVVDLKTGEVKRHDLSDHLRFDMQVTEQSQFNCMLISEPCGICVMHSQPLHENDDRSSQVVELFCLSMEQTDLKVAPFNLCVGPKLEQAQLLLVDSTNNHMKFKCLEFSPLTQSKIENTFTVFNLDIATYKLRPCLQENQELAEEQAQQTKQMELYRDISNEDKFIQLADKISRLQCI